MHRNKWFLVAATAILAGVAWLGLRHGGSNQRFATPIDCLEAYREACISGDVDAYLDCLAEPLRTEQSRRFPNPDALAWKLQQDMKEVKSWTVVGPGETASEATEVRLEVDMAGPSGTWRTAFDLQQQRGSWLITAIGPRREVPTDIPYGTHISDVP